MNIEKEVQRLMDIEAIKDLKNRYARMCNDNHNYELVDTIFSYRRALPSSRASYRDRHS